MAWLGLGVEVDIGGGLREPQGFLPAGGEEAVSGVGVSVVEEEGPERKDSLSDKEVGGQVPSSPSATTVAVGDNSSPSQEISPSDSNQDLEGQEQKRHSDLFYSMRFSAKQIFIPQMLNGHFLR